MVYFPSAFSNTESSTRQRNERTLHAFDGICKKRETVHAKFEALRTFKKICEKEATTLL